MVGQNQQVNIQKCLDAYAKWLVTNHTAICEKTGLYTEGLERNFFYNKKRERQQCEHKKTADASCLKKCFSYMAYLDLVAFKAVNDRFSHPMGDALLAGFGALFKKHINNFNAQNANDANWLYIANAFRHGGDEFTVLLTPKFLLCERSQRDNDDAYAHVKLVNAMRDFLSMWSEQIWSVQSSITTGAKKFAWIPVRDGGVAPASQSGVAPASQSGVAFASQPGIGSIQNSVSAPVSDASGASVLDGLQTKRENVQELLIKGLKIRCGYGTDVEEAEKDMKGEETERGVFNQDCLFFIPAHHESDRQKIEAKESWRRLCDYIIYVIPRDIYGQMEKELAAIIMSVMEKITDQIQSPFVCPKIEREDQGKTIFICVPTWYEQYRDRIVSEDLWPFDKGKFPISRLAYIAAIKGEIYSGLDKENLNNRRKNSIYYLSGTSVMKAHAKK